MKRFKLLVSRRSNPHLTFLHIHCQMSLDTISQCSGISRKTIGRILMGQLPTKQQIRILSRVATICTRELEKLLSYERTSREGMYAGNIISHMSHLGRSLSRHETIKGKTRT